MRLRGKQGRAWLYAPVRSREAYAAALMVDGLGESKDRSADRQLSCLSSPSQSVKARPCAMGG